MGGGGREGRRERRKIIRAGEHRPNAILEEIIFLFFPSATLGKNVPEPSSDLKEQAGSTFRIMSKLKCKETAYDCKWNQKLACKKRESTRGIGAVNVNFHW